MQEAVRWDGNLKWLKCEELSVDRACVQPAFAPQEIYKLEVDEVEGELESGIDRGN